MREFNVEDHKYIVVENEIYNPAHATLRKHIITWTDQIYNHYVRHETALQVQDTQVGQPYLRKWN